MIDWSKERANLDYCGWCTGGPIASCDGGCLKNEETHRRDHLKRERKKAYQRLKDIKEELKKDFI